MSAKETDTEPRHRIACVAVLFAGYSLAIVAYMHNAPTLPRLAHAGVFGAAAVAFYLLCRTALGPVGSVLLTSAGPLPALLGGDVGAVAPVLVGLLATPSTLRRAASLGSVSRISHYLMTIGALAVATVLGTAVLGWTALMAWGLNVGLGVFCLGLVLRSYSEGIRKAWSPAVTMLLLALALALLAAGAQYAFAAGPQLVALGTVAAAWIALGLRGEPVSFQGDPASVSVLVRQ